MKWPEQVICYSVLCCFSYWNNPDKIGNIEHLSQMEDSLRESLNRIRMQKVWCHSSQLDSYGKLGTVDSLVTYLVFAQIYHVNTPQFQNVSFFWEFHRSKKTHICLWTIGIDISKLDKQSGGREYYVCGLEP